MTSEIVSVEAMFVLDDTLGPSSLIYKESPLVPSTTPSTTPSIADLPPQPQPTTPIVVESNNTAPNECEVVSERIWESMEEVYEQEIKPKKVDAAKVEFKAPTKKPISDKAVNNSDKAVNNSDKAVNNSDKAVNNSVRAVDNSDRAVDISDEILSEVKDYVAKLSVQGPAVVHNHFYFNK
jgi:hypothetical protein